MLSIATMNAESASHKEPLCVNTTGVGRYVRHLRSLFLTGSKSVPDSLIPLANLMRPSS